MQTDPVPTATAPPTDAVYAWFSSLTAFEWIGIVVGIVAFIILLCRILGFDVVAIIFELLGCFAD